MAYIKWRRDRPFVYRSIRETLIEITTENGRHSAKDGKQKVTTEYLGSYQKYREVRPCGRYSDMICSETLLKMIAGNQERLDILQSIDAEVALKFEEGRIKK